MNERNLLVNSKNSEKKIWEFVNTKCGKNRQNTITTIEKLKYSVSNKDLSNENNADCMNNIFVIWGKLANNSNNNSSSNKCKKAPARNEK